jgi:tetratricopeptide (TPR) repeat protein
MLSRGIARTLSAPFFRVAFSALFGAACGVALAVPAPPAASARAVSPRAPEEVAAAREYFVLARQSDRVGDVAAALEWYRLAFRHDAGSRDLCFLYLERLKDAGAVDSALATARACMALAGDTVASSRTPASPGSPASSASPAFTALSAGEHKLLGEIALRAEDPGKALRHYRAAYELNEEDGDVLYVLAGLYEERGEWQAYTGVVERLLPRLGYPARLMERLARAYGQLNRPADLIPALRAAWEETESPQYGQALAAYYDSKGLDLSLLDVAERLAAQDPAPEFLWMLARAYAGANRPDSALAVSTRLLKLQPDHPGVRLLHATLLFDRGKYKEAQRAAASLAKEFPDVAAYPQLAGSAALELGRGEARALLEKAVALAPSSPEARAVLAYADYVAGDSSRAMARLVYAPGDSLEPERALLLEGVAHAQLAGALEPREPGDRPAVLTDTLAARRHRRLALQRFEAILARNSGHRAALFEAGSQRERLGDRAGAKALLRRLVERDTLHALAMNYLAYTIVEQDSIPPAEMTEAGLLLDRSLALEPENGAFRDSKGWWYYRGGDQDSARAWLERAADAMPADPAVLDHLLQAYYALDARADACAVLRRLRRLNPAHSYFLHCPVDEKPSGPEDRP